MDDKNKENKHKKSEDGWTVANRIKAMSVIGTLLVAVGSAIGSLIANKTSSQAVQAVESTRVEIGDASSNSNYKDYANSWTPWVSPVSTKTLFVGVQRNVVFAHPFTSVPHVTTALEGIDTKSPDLILTKLGYSPPDKSTADRLLHISIYTGADRVTEKGFTLQVGIGLPTQPGEFLTRILSAKYASRNEWFANDNMLIQNMIQGRQLSGDRSGLILSQNELWLLNFYKSIGSIDVSWTAQSR